ncbi:3-hydroxyacyl-ACP dehydratase [Brachyspira murdochii]|uniref:3-hydroxyacyl-ACP dehydratase n=1 Tax=Brachyspira murdochii TaxID=84378 RepID=UPI0012F4FEBE|nr:3-hydroxyacyl-ACP dehydratase [Brachyspira murdochii]
MENKYKLNIPHKGRMLLIDGIVDINFDDNEILTFSQIKKDNVFYDNNEGIDSYIFTEYAAQTAAAYNGALENSSDDKRIGFLLNIKKADCYIDKVKAENKVYIFVKETLKDGNIAYYDGNVIICNDDIKSIEEYKNIISSDNIKKVMDCSIMVMESSAKNFGF